MTLAAYLFAVAAALVVTGVALVSVPVALIVAGPLLAAWTVVVVLEVG